MKGLFKFNKKHYVNKVFDVSDLLSYVYKKNMSSAKDYIESVTLSYVLKRESTPHSHQDIDCMSEIYIMDVVLNKPGLPLKFLEKLSNSIKIPHVLTVHYKDYFRYIVPIRIEEKDKLVLKRVVYTGWMTEGPEFYIAAFDPNNEYSVFEAYKRMLSIITNVIFEDNMSLSEYIDYMKSIYGGQYSNCFTGSGGFKSVKELLTTIDGKNHSSTSRSFDTYCKDMMTIYDSLSSEEKHFSRYTLFYDTHYNVWHRTFTIESNFVADAENKENDFYGKKVRKKPKKQSRKPRNQSLWTKLPNYIPQTKEEDNATKKMSSVSCMGFFTKK